MTRLVQLVPGELEEQVAVDKAEQTKQPNN
jgi:hypothetical protein